MHRRNQGNQALVRFDPEIEAATRQLSREVRRKKRAEVSMAEDHRVLRDYALPQASGITSSIVSPQLRLTTSSSAPHSSLLWSESSSLNTHRRTPTRIFVSSLRNTTPSRSMGRPAMLSDCASSLSHLEIEPVIGYRTRSPTRSPLETCSKAFLSKYFPPGQDCKAECRDHVIYSEG